MMSQLVFHSFTLERAGRGFKTVEYRSSFGKSHDVFSNDPTVKLEVLKIHATLAKIKKDFICQDIFTCAIEGHSLMGTAPSTLIQLVVEGPKEKLEKVRRHYEAKSSYLLCDFHLQYEWMDQVPKNVLEEWLAF